MRDLNSKMFLLKILKYANQLSNNFFFFLCDFDPSKIFQNHTQDQGQSQNFEFGGGGGGFTVGYVQ